MAKFLMNAAVQLSFLTPQLQRSEKKHNLWFVTPTCLMIHLVYLMGKTTETDLMT